MNTPFRVVGTFESQAVADYAMGSNTVRNTLRWRFPTLQFQTSTRWCDDQVSVGLVGDSATDVYMERVLAFLATVSWRELLDTTV